MRQPNEKRVTLKGTRFDGGRLPVDALIELQNYQEVIRIALESEWQQGHPGEDLPADLHSSVGLTIERIEDGSAEVYMVVEAHQQYAQYQIDARTAADATLSAAYAEGPMPPVSAVDTADDERMREQLATIGASLSADDIIEIYSDVPGAAPVVITASTRQYALPRLVSPSETEPAIASVAGGLETTAGSLVGRVTGIKANKMTFTLTLADDREINCRYRNKPELLEDLRELINSPDEGPDTRVSGQLQRRAGNVYRFWEVDTVEQIGFGTSAWAPRLRELLELPVGWDEGDATPIDSVALQAADAFLRRLSETSIEIPAIFPAQDAAVLLEWAEPERVTSVEVTSGGGFDLFAMSPGQSATHGSTLSLDEALEFVVAEQEKA